MVFEILGALAALVTIGEIVIKLPAYLHRLCRWTNAHRMARKERKRKNRRPPKDE